MHATTIRTALAVALTGLALAGCGNGTDAAPSATSAATTTTPAAPAASDPVAIDDFRFSPDTLTVTAGTAVTWSNEDATAHTVTAGTEGEPRPAEFDLRVDAKGQTVSVTLDEPGTYAYFCRLHPFMQATIEVTG